ncbi:MAG: hypothetical protein CMG46_02710 [Candidatus Marinimicrobia bacterium]|nr:hypothetical protein [Candidatus Neomarinimicrobiota bacterium]
MFKIFNIYNMEYLSDAYQKSEKYRNAVNKLPEGWETLVTLNYMILQYGVREWQQDRMEDIIYEMKKRKVTVKDLRSQTNVVGKGSMKKGELLNLRAKEELRENFKDDSYPFGDEIASFVERNKDTLQRVIRRIRPGSHGLLRFKDIQDIDSRVYQDEASRDLMYFANPLFTVHSLIDYRSIGYDNKTELTWAHELHDHKKIISASMKTLQSMTQHGLEITKLLLENIYDIRLLNHQSSINSIINIILSANKVNIDVNVGYPRFHQTGLGIHSKYNLDILLLLFEHGLQNHRYGDIQDFDLIVGPNGWHVSQFSTEQAEVGIPDHLIQYEPIHSLTKITQYGSRRTPLQEPKTLFHLCEPDVLPQANNPYNVESIRKLWMDTIKLQKAQQNLSLAKGMKDPDSYVYDIPEPKLFETIGGPGRGSSKKAAQALRRQSVGRLSDKKELFDAQQRLEAAKMLYPGEDDESYLGDDDINVSNKIRDSYLEKGDIPFSERRVNRYFKEKKDEEGKISRMKEMMVPKFPERIDASLSLQRPEFSEGMRVSWDYRGEKRFGTVVEVREKGAMIRTDEGKEFPKPFKLLTPEVDDTGSYWNPDGGGKRKRKKRSKQRSKKKKRTKSNSKSRKRTKSKNN